MRSKALRNFGVELESTYAIMKYTRGYAGTHVFGIQLVGQWQDETYAHLLHPTHF